MRFWNATDACCNLYGATVDDSAYLTDLIKMISTQYTVDPRRVYLVGHSNGAFMSFRMACDHADIITAIAALNGRHVERPDEVQPVPAGERAQHPRHGRLDHPLRWRRHHRPHVSVDRDHRGRLGRPRRLHGRAGYDRPAARSRCLAAGR
jgi:pimeloyl-ACP methyl ester carboxylesterase